MADCVSDETGYSKDAICALSRASFWRAGARKSSALSFFSTDNLGLARDRLEAAD
jgi:hypothetical protein